MAPRPPKKVHRFQFACAKEDLDKLTELAEHFKMSAADVTRRAIHNLHSMAIGHVPICAHGEACQVPQLMIPRLEHAAATAAEDKPAAKPIAFSAA